MSIKVVLGLGSNLGDRQQYLLKALERIETTIGRISRKSALYETVSWGFSAEEKFLNQVIITETELSPAEVLKQILQIESECGRVRQHGSDYTSRTLDIDILYFGDLIISEDDLVIPHPRLENRKFVLLPLVETDPEFVHPVLKKTNRMLLMECTDNLDVKFYE